MDIKEIESIIWILQDMLDDLDRDILDCEKDALRGAIAYMKGSLNEIHNTSRTEDEEK